MPNRIHQHRGYRVSIYSPSGHFAIITASGNNRVIDLGQQARSTIVEGANVCLARAIKLIDDQLGPTK